MSHFILKIALYSAIFLTSQSLNFCTHEMEIIIPQYLRSIRKISVWHEASVEYI